MQIRHSALSPAPTGKEISPVLTEHARGQPMMEMKMIDWDKPIETMEGNPARVISTDHRYSGENLAVIQIEHPGFSCVGYYHQNGEPTFGSVRIRNRKTKREGWINIHRHDRTGEAIYKTKEEAEGSAVRKITTIKIEWEE